MRSAVIQSGVESSGDYLGLIFVLLESLVPCNLFLFVTRSFEAGYLETGFRGVHDEKVNTNKPILIRASTDPLVDKYASASLTSNACGIYLEIAPPYYSKRTLRERDQQWDLDNGGTSQQQKATV